MDLRRKKPLLSQTEVIDQIYHRTGIPRDTIHKILESYREILIDCLLMGVEVSIRGLGTFTYKDNKPKKYTIRMDTKHHKAGDVIDCPGYWIPFFRPTNAMREKMKELTKYGEVNGIEGENSID